MLGAGWGVCRMCRGRPSVQQTQPGAYLRLGSVMFVLANTLQAIAVVLGSLVKIYFWVVIIAALVSWVRPDPYNPIVRALHNLTEPVFYQVRKLLPFTYASGMDFSPIVVLLVLELIERIIVTSLLQYAATF